MWYSSCNAGATKTHQSCLLPTHGELKYRMRAPVVLVVVTCLVARAVVIQRVFGANSSEISHASAGECLRRVFSQAAMSSPAFLLVCCPARLSCPLLLLLSTCLHERLALWCRCMQ